MLNRNSQSVLDNGMQSSTYKDFLKSHDVVETYLCKILEDCFNMNPQYKETDYLRDKNTIQRRFCHEGLSFATKTLPSFWDSLLTYLETGNSVYPSFRLAKGESYPVFLRQLVRPIYMDPNSEMTVICMKCIFQLCAAFKKLKGPYKQNVLIKQLDDFLATDNELQHHWSADSKDPILSKARNLIRQVCENLDPFNPVHAEKFLPRPGPGATNTPTEKHERYRPHVLYDQLEDVFPIDDWYSPHPLNYRGYKGTVIGGASSVGENFFPIKKGKLLTSRFKFVHKTFGKPRCICIEQLEMQWLQQALRGALYDLIETHPLTKGFVSFTDQSINGLLALRASDPMPDVCYSSIHEYVSSHVQLATIDMSAASDRISRDLVVYLFQDCPQLLKSLLTLSTRIIELPKEISENRRYLFAKKFAPMGSALCFPVMGLIHFALVKSIISMVSPQHINDIPVWVYGDDIIIPSRYTDAVFELLPKFGMKLNTGKSFVKSRFRESCGVNAYNGIDITPVRFKSIVRNPLSVNDVVTALQNEAVFFKNGYKATAAFIRSEITAWPELMANKLPIVGPESFILGWIREDQDAYVNVQQLSMFRRRWKSDLQRYHYKVRVVVDLLDDSPPVYECEYYLRKQVMQTPFARQIDGSPLRLSIQWRWLPDSAFCRT